MAKKLLEVNSLKVTYHTYAGAVQSVRGVSFDVEEGETVAIVGESGCGKTVTAKSVMGLIMDPGEISPDSQILYNGVDITKYNKKEWAKYRGGECSMIFQDALTSLNPTMKVGKQIAENIKAHRDLHGKELQEEVVNLLRMVGIPNPESRVNEYPHQFSGGMRQRAMIAIALACNPKLLIADEPTTALDVTIQAQILDLIKDLQNKLGTAVILITHDLGVVAGIAKRVFVMYAGKVVEKGTVRDIFYSPKHPYTAALLNAVPRLDLSNKQTLATIEGTPPNLLAPPKGCPFSSRCSYCMGICKKEMPPVTSFEGIHEAYCWLHDERAPKVDITSAGVESL